MSLKNPFQLAALIVFVTQPVFAQDLESLLDEGSKPAVKQTVAEKELTGFSVEIKRLLDTPTSEQNVFLRQIEAGEWDKATLQYPIAFEGTAFQKSATGRAVFGLVQFNAGLPVTGLETLFQGQPKDIAGAVRDQWRKVVDVTHFAWDLAQVQWSADWQDIFGSEVDRKFKLRQLSTLTNVNDLKALAASTSEGSAERAKIEWQLVLAYSINDEADKAAKLLAGIMKVQNLPVSKDLMNITAARLLYQNGYFDAAIKYYEKIPKASEFWAESQEEVAWAYIRKGEPQNAIAISRSLVNSAMVSQVSPEAYFVSALSRLKVCDYTGVSQNLREFPVKFKERTKVLAEISKGGESADITKAIELLKNRKIRIEELGGRSRNLPRMLTRDEKLYDFVQAQKHFENEAKVADVIYAKSLAQTGLQGSFERLKQTTLQRAQTAQAAAATRVKELAQIEVGETKEILRKLHIVEAEVIQQVALSDKIIKNTASTTTTEKKGTTGAKGQDTLRFPADDEVWFDEISNYKVDVKKACHAKR